MKTVNFVHPTQRSYIGCGILTEKNVCAIVYPKGRSTAHPESNGKASPPKKRRFYHGTFKKVFISTRD